MNRARQALEAYLGRIGQLKPVPLGDGDEKQPTEADNDFLRGELAKARRFYTTAATISMGVLLAVCSFGILLMFVQTDVMALRTVFGGCVGTIVGVVLMLRKLLSGKFFIDTISALILEMSPQEAAKYMSLLYLEQFRKRKRA